MRRAIASAFLLIAAVALDERPPVIIVTGLAHGGTTVTSELIMTAPGLLGPFETGFLLANRPAAFINTKPFAEWTQGTGAGSLGLAGPHFRELLRQRTHLDMYSYALREAPMFVGTNTTRFVDKTPAYWEKLELILRRAPGVPVVFVYKTRATAHRSWVQKRHAGEASFRGMWNRFTWQLGIAQRHPRVHTVSFEDLFVHRKGRTRKALFEFLGLKGFSPDFSGRALAAKRGRCHLCDHSVAKHRRPRNETAMKEAARARRR
jgi:hypothetical protein